MGINVYAMYHAHLWSVPLSVTQRFHTLSVHCHLNTSTRMGPSSCLSSSSNKPTVLARLTMRCSLTRRVTWQRTNLACTIALDMIRQS